MGQEQSNLVNGSEPSGLRAAEQDGFRVVQTAISSGAGDVSSDPTVRAVQGLPSPHPVLPPPSVRDDVTSALSGAQMMRELRAAFGSMLPLSAGQVTHPNSMPSSVQLVDNPETSETTSFEFTEDVTSSVTRSCETGARMSNFNSMSAVSAAALSTPSPEREVNAPSARSTKSALSEETAARRLQEQWARVVLDIAAVSKAVDVAGGGDALVDVLNEQERLIQRVGDAHLSAERVQSAMEATEKEASRTRKALESLERLRMAVADVQDGLEAGVATANILGASHFADDDELRSFKDFLIAHPPNYPDD